MQLPGNTVPGKSYDPIPKLRNTMKNTIINIWKMQISAAFPFLIPHIPNKDPMIIAISAPKAMPNMVFLY